MPFKTDHHVISAIHDPAHWSASGSVRWIPECSCGWRAKGSGSRKKTSAVTRGEAEHLDKVKTKCPTPGKRRYQTEAEAEADMHKFWSRPHSGKSMPIRVYECPCGKWHTTSRPRRY